MTLNTALRAGAWGVLIAAGLWVLVIVLERAFVFGIPLGYSAAAAGAVGLALMIANVLRARIDALAAAVVLDEAAGLKERISSALTYRRSNDPFAQATLHDAEKIAGGVHVPSHVKYRAPELWPWSVASVAVALLCFFFLPVMNLLAEQSQPDQTDGSATVEERKAVEVAMQTQIEKIKERLADKPALAELQNEIDKLQLPNEPTKTPEDIRREAVKKIENVADKWRERLESNNLQAHDQLKRELAKLETPKGDDPASKLIETLAAGDMEGAKDAMSKLKQELEQAAKSGDAEAKQKLNEMADKLDAFSKQLEQLAEQQKLEKDLENKAGLSEDEAKKLLESLKDKNIEQIAKELQKKLAEKGLTKEQIQQMAKKIAQNQQMQQQLKSLAKSMSQMGKT